MQEWSEGGLAALTHWLADTRLSHTLQQTDWAVPAIQSVHILSIAAVFSSALMLLLAAFGLYGAEQPVARQHARFRGVLALGLLALLATGLLMICAEPERALPNRVFQLKMLLVLLAAVTSAAAGRLMRANRRTSAGAAIRALTGASLLLWSLALVAGRFIAYTLTP